MRRMTAARASRMRLEFDIDCRESARLNTQVSGRVSLCCGAVLDIVLAALATADGPRRLQHLDLLSPIEPSGIRAGRLVLDPKLGFFELLSGHEEDSRCRLHVTG